MPKTKKIYEAIIATYQFEVITEEGKATVYTDDVEEFLDSFEIRKLPNVKQCINEHGITVALPRLEGFNGPFLCGRSLRGEAIVGYEERAG